MLTPSRGLLKLLSKKELSVKVTGVTFEVVEPKGFLFRPGQFVTLMFGQSGARAYSICSDVNDLPNLSLAIETGHDGVGSNYFKNMKVGDELSFIGPSGRLLLPENLPKHLYFFATGTGIAPFISLFCRLTDLKYKGKVDLLFGVRKESQMLFLGELKDFKKKLPGLNYKIFYSRPEIATNVSERITSVLPGITDKEALYFLCGHPLMIEQVLKGLTDNGIDTKNIIKELFTHPKQTGKV